MQPPDPGAPRQFTFSLNQRSRYIKNTADIEVFGIRHHGPGSARSLLAALHAWQPDILLVEGPPDADALLSLCADPQMRPPVALLVYNPKQLSQASFYPFAEFSPEWQAILYAFRQNIPVRFMDLPLSLAFPLAVEETPQLTLQLGDAPDTGAVDPFRDIARLAGYTDPERWWEASFERLSGGAVSPAPETFAVVLELMRTLRDSKNIPETPETLLREAHMRQVLRAAQKEGFRRLAVVCGAWHAPALADPDAVKASADAALLKGLKKVKTTATWIPWSFDRLATQSGYAAGVIAPAWYRMLWNAESGHDATARWFTQAARLLREQDIPTSSAHVIEAVRLAEGLSALRLTELPGIEELREAAVTVLCEGSERSLDLIDRQLVIGDVLGAAPDAAPMVPLRADFEAQLKSCRLERSTAESSLALDLREDAHLRKSRLLHRLDLLGIPWGQTQDVGSGKQGRFHESWKMKWLPDYEIRLVEAGAWGNTVEEAATRKAQRSARTMENLPRLTALLGQILKAELPAVMPVLLQKLQHISALATDALMLADTVLPLVEVLRYGSARRLNLPAIEQLLDQIVPRACLQLPAACTGVNEEVAADVLKTLLGFNRGLDLLRTTDFEEAWRQTLQALSQAPGMAALLAGFATRLLLDKKLLQAAQAADLLQFRLSKGQPPAEAAQWLDGFLQGSGLLLLHHANFWQLLDDWMCALPESAFKEMLPLLRRTFSRFPQPEREKMLDLAKNGRRTGADLAEAWDVERAKLVLPVLQGILMRLP